MTTLQHEIALAAPEDIASLPEIERIAGLQFKAFPGLRRDLRRGPAGRTPVGRSRC